MMDLTRPTDHQRAYPWAAVLLAHAFLGQQAAALLHAVMPMWAAVFAVFFAYLVIGNDTAGEDFDISQFVASGGNITLHGNRFEIDDAIAGEAFAFMVNAAVYGTDGKTVVNFVTDLGGNIWPEGMGGHRHNNSAVTPKTMAEFLALVDPDAHDVSGFA